MSGAYYSEHDPVAAEWLRNLIAEGLLPAGDVDERDIRDVTPAELVRYTQCHFFAGIGLWPAALRRAGWPDDRRIWTGSCPCQPFSAAGAGEGFDDERHLWPHWYWLIWNCRPPVIAGEQVAGKDGLGWYDLVSADLGGAGYTSGAVNICAGGFGLDWRGSAESQRLERAIRLCPDPLVARHMGAFADWADQTLGFGGFHVRQRLYFVGLADFNEQGNGGRGHDRSGQGAGASEGFALERPSGLRAVDELADQSGGGRGVSGDASLVGQGGYVDGGSDPTCRLVDGERPRLEGLGGDGGQGDQPGRVRSDAARPTAPAGDAVELAKGPPSDANYGGWPAVDWLFCRDGYWRPAEGGTFPLVAKDTARVGKLRAFGNAIDVATAEAFCEVVTEVVHEADARTKASMVS